MGNHRGRRGHFGSGVQHRKRLLLVARRGAAQLPAQSTRRYRVGARRLTWRLSGWLRSGCHRENDRVSDVMGRSGVRVEVRLLGPVGLSIDGTERDLGSPKQRCVFAVLALSAGQVVSVDRLVQEVWGDEAGDKAISTLAGVHQPDPP